MSTVTRVQRLVRPANVTIANAATGTITFAHPSTSDPNSALRGTKQRLGVTPSEPLGVQSTMPTLPLQDRAGYCSVTLDALWLLATVFLDRIELVDANGVVLETLFSAVGAGLAMNVVANQDEITRLVINSGESVRLALRNTSGGPLVGSGVGRYDLGINPNMVNTEVSFSA